MEIHSTPTPGATTSASGPGVMRTPAVLATPAILQLVALVTRAPAQAAAGFATPPLRPAAPVALAAVGALAQAAATGILAPVVAAGILLQGFILVQEECQPFRWWPILMGTQTT